MSDRFTVENLKPVMRDRPFRFFDTIGSTQDAAREWALSDPDLPAGKPDERLAIVIAEEQTAGRGRQGRTWHSPTESSIMFSAILKPDLPPEKLPRVTMIGAVAVAEALFPTLPNAVTLKWPNDILIRGKKAGGILSEAVWDGDKLRAVILGVGVNMRVDFGEIELMYPATNVETERGRTMKRHDLLQLILARLDYWAGQIDTVNLFEAWRQRLGTIGQRVTIYTEPDRSASSSYSGIAESVDETGALFVRVGEDDLRRVVAADVGLAENGAAS